MLLFIQQICLRGLLISYNLNMKNRIYTYKNDENGFTVIEFMIVLLITAIFITVAVPSYYSLIQNNKVVSVTNKLSASFNFARMEAIKRGARVSVCSAGNTSYTACGNSSQWSQGWIIFTDADNNNAIDSSNDLVKIAEALPSGTTINSNLNVVSYDGTGFTTTNALTMSLTASGCKGNNSRTINIATSGRLSVASAQCN
jgi:type IV fimbrial biogenesis protein FimT